MHAGNGGIVICWFAAGLRVCWGGIGEGEAIRMGSTRELLAACDTHLFVVTHTQLPFGCVLRRNMWHAVLCCCLQGHTAGPLWCAGTACG